MEAVPIVRLFENHSSALIAWRHAEVRDRILVHLDGHSDLDWLPDETVARLAAARPEELTDLELHPYALDGTTHQRFAIWNFVYPAARLGVIRHLVWVVPDGTMRDPASRAAVAREMLVLKPQMVTPDEALALREVDRRIEGTVLGLPVTLCELADLPDFDEPVLLDIDLDYFTTRSALSQEVTAVPWVLPETVLRALADKGLRSDMVTLSLSTLGGFLPPANRWLGRVLQEQLRSGSTAAAPFEQALSRAFQAQATGRVEEAAEILEALTQEQPAEASVWYALARALGTDGRAAEADRARARAVTLDPLLEHAELFEADALFLSGRWSEALERYRAYLKRVPRGPFTPWAHRREATSLMRLDRVDEAVSAMGRVVRMAPQHGDSRLDLGVLLRERGSLDDAIVELKEARRILPDLSTYAMALGTTYLHLGRTEDGVRELAQAVSRKPCWAQARINLTLGLMALSRDRDAAEQLTVAKRFLAPNPQMRQIEAQLRQRGITLAVSPPRR